MSVAVEFPIEEAEALLKRLDPDGFDAMTGDECDALEAGQDRLRRAAAIERGPGGAHELDALEDLAKALIGHDVVVHCTYGEVSGRLEKIVGFRSLLLKDRVFRMPVNLSLVDSIELAEAST